MVFKLFDHKNPVKNLYSCVLPDNIVSDFQTEGLKHGYFLTTLVDCFHQGNVGNNAKGNVHIKKGKQEYKLYRSLILQNIANYLVEH